MNKDDYIIEDTFNPQSRFEHLEHIEPEFWKKKNLRKCPPKSGSFFATAAANVV